MRYRLYSLSWATTGATGPDEGELGAAAASYIEAVREDTDGVIWQHDGFSLQPVLGDGVWVGSGCVPGSVCTSVCVCVGEGGGGGTS